MQIKNYSGAVRFKGQGRDKVQKIQKRPEAGIKAWEWSQEFRPGRQIVWRGLGSDSNGIDGPCGIA